MAGSYKNSEVERAEEAFKAGWRTFRELLLALKSADAPTRRAAVLFHLGILGVLAVLFLSILHLKHRLNPVHVQTIEEQQAEILKQILEKEKMSKEQHAEIFRVGSFGMQMKDVAGSKPLPGVVGMAELEIQVQCDTKETCQYLAENVIPLKDLVAPMLNPMDRDVLMSVEGKEKLKLTLQDKMNRWLPKGHIEKVFLSRLLID